MIYLIVIILLGFSHVSVAFKAYSYRGKLCHADMVLMEEAFKVSLNNKKAEGDKEAEKIDKEVLTEEQQVSEIANEILKKIYSQPNDTYICTDPDVLRGLAKLR